MNEVGGKTLSYNLNLGGGEEKCAYTEQKDRTATYQNVDSYYLWVIFYSASLPAKSKFSRVNILFFWNKKDKGYIAEYFASVQLMPEP